MPLYETVMQEKPPVVLDIGTAYTKLGFAAEAYPRKIIPSAITLNGNETPLFNSSDSAVLYDKIVDFLQVVFFKHLLVSPKERKIVIVENVFGPTLVRETLARVLFRHFDVSSVLFVPSHMIALSSLAIATGVVVDIGYCETTVLPVFSGVQIMKAFQDQKYGGRAVHAEIKRQLIEAGNKESVLSEEILEDIKVRFCFVTTLERAQCYRNKTDLPTPPTADIQYPICSDDVIIVPGHTRETAFEVLFDLNNDCDSLPHLIIKSILSCPVDFRRNMIENMFIIGGSSIVMGMLPRLKAELQYLIANEDDYKTKLQQNRTFKFHKRLGRQNISAWLGASLCGGTDLIHSRSLTKDSYNKFNHVPDWISLIDNRVTG